MEPRNNTQTLDFILLGFSEGPELQPFLVGLFLSMYLVTIFGNLLIILATTTDSHLQTPRYFFLSNLSFSDMCLVFTTTPNMLVNFQTQNKAISYAGCLTQMYFFLVFAALKDFLLAMMAYDCFMVICQPLHYMVKMNSWTCVLLVLGSWIISVLNSLLQRSVVLQLSFCTHLEIPHFFCELSEMVHLACSDIFINDIMMYISAGLLGVVPLPGFLFSYSKIVSSKCAISSAQGKYKAFSTYVSHLSVFSLFYCSCLGVHFSSAAPQNIHSSAQVSMMYTVITLMLNPFIYSLRNKDIKGALKNFIGRKSKHHWW